MTVVPWVSPASAPPKPKIFAKLSDAVPEPEWNLVPTVTVEIDVKRLSYQVFRR